MKRRLYAAGAGAVVAVLGGVFGPGLVKDYQAYSAGRATERELERIQDSQREEKLAKVRALHAARDAKLQQENQRKAQIQEQKKQQWTRAQEIRKALAENKLPHAKRLLEQYSASLGDQRQPIEEIINNRVLTIERNQLSQGFNSLLTPNTYAQAQAEFLKLQQSGKFDDKMLAEFQSQLSGAEPMNALDAVLKNPGKNKTTGITQFIDNCNTCPEPVISKAYAGLAEDAVIGIDAVCSQTQIDLGAIGAHTITLSGTAQLAKKRGVAVETLQGIDEKILNCLDEARMSARAVTGYSIGGKSLTGYRFGGQGRAQFDTAYARLSELSVQAVKLSWDLKQMDDIAFTEYALERAKKNDGTSADFFEYLAKTQGASRIELSAMANNLSKHYADKGDFHTAMYFQLKSTSFKNPLQ